MKLWLCFFSLMVATVAGAQAPEPTAEPTPTPGPALGFLPASKPGFAQTPEARSFEAICPTVRMEGGKAFKFKDMEQRLICGDSKDDSVGKPWAVIPPDQAAYFLRGFLQARGYHEPEFVQDGDQLFVRPGPESHLERFRVAGGPATWSPPHRRLVEGAALTPPLLDDLQGWALTEIKNEGYACATGTTRADPLSGEALVTLKPNRLRYINGFDNTGESGLEPGVLDRYNAFRVGDLYREDLIALTRKRTQDDGFLQTYIMTTRCDPEGVTIVRDVVLGPSRTVRVGVGATTDSGAIMRASVRENRIGPSASSAQARVNLSYLNGNINRQKADANYTWYYAGGEPRSYLQPSITFDHDAEDAFNTQSVEAKLLHGWTHEAASGQFEVRAGPTYLDSSLYRGIGPNNVKMVYLDTEFRWTSHSFEYFSTSPRGGENLQSAIYIADQGAGADFTAQKFQLQGEKLWSIFPDDPPLLILGARFNISTINSPNDGIATLLPKRFLTFLGGDSDLRGFDPTSLPRSGVGALSGATVSGEARLHKVIFKIIDVFGFVDSGVLGDRFFGFARPYLMSPGAGVRWESPVGVLRLYLARRFALDQDPNDVPYDQANRVGFTFGQEF